MAVRPIPDGYHAVTPYLIVEGAARALDFYKDVFGATEQMRMAGPAGRVAHAEIRIGDSVVMLADEVQDQFYGDRSGTLEDPFGHIWTVSTHVEDLTPEEISQRAEQAMKQG